MNSKITGTWQIAAAFALVMVLSTGAMADSSTVSYQGVLRDDALNPVADGSYAMEFAIYAVPDGGSPVWGPEAHPSVTTTNGMFSVYLGESTALGTLFADHSALWLEITADTGDGFETYAPRVSLASVPYAQHAQNADDATTLSGQTFADHNADDAAHPALHLPPGVLMPFGGTSAPSGYLLCAGQAVSRTTYEHLFAAIGTTYGAGDGSTTFNLPDLRGRVPMGLDNMDGNSANRVTAAEADTPGGTAGAENHTLTTAQMPSHNHGVNDPGHSHGYVGRRDEGFCIQSHGTCEAGNWQETRNTTQNTTGISIQNSGGGQAHNNMQPYVALNYIIKY